MLRRVVLFSLGLLITNQLTILGAPVFGKVQELRQPDGSLITVRIWGDEFYQVVESPDGYTLIRDPKTGSICYADLSADGNELLSTGIPYNQNAAKQADSSVAQLSLKPHLRISTEAAQEKVETLRAQFDRQLNTDSVYTKSNLTSPLSTSANTSGEVRGICLLIDFPDEPGVISPDEIDRMLNETGYSNYGNNGSVRDYYFEVSGGRLTYTNYVTPWYYTAQNEKSFYDNDNIGSTARTHLLLKEALNYLESTGFDFSDFDSNGDGAIDAIHGFYAGNTYSGWGHGLWPHTSIVNFEADGVHTRRYQVCPISEFPTIGIFCHESGHVLFDWPDLYDYDFDSRGVGYFCLMSNGDFDLNPVHPCAYLKEVNGWLETTVLDKTQDCILQAHTNTAFKIKHPSYGGEYYLIENRSQTGRDTELPDGGLAIWHIDRTLGNQRYQQQTARKHYLVTLVQADGRWDLEGRRNAGDTEDLWGAPEKTTFDPSTTPAAMWWDDYPSGVYITSISEPDETMTFSFRLDSTPEPGSSFNTHANFPDSNFRLIVEEFLEVAPYGYFTEARIAAVSAIKSQLIINDRELESLEGIQYFSGLTWLNCSDNNLTYLDVSALPRLERLYCSNNKLQNLITDGCQELTAIDCRVNRLKELNLATNKKLISINCGNNIINTLDISDHTALIDMYCYQNAMSQLNVSGCTELTYLECHNNKLDFLDVSGLKKLQVLQCFQNNLKEINAQACESLTKLRCFDNWLSKLELLGCSALEYLDCSDCDIWKINLTDCVVMQRLYCQANRIKELDLHTNQALEEVHCYLNQLTKIDLPPGDALKTIFCRSNNLQELDLSGCKGLISLDCSTNDFIRLDTRENKNLKTLDCTHNSLSELLVAGDGNLTLLECSYNPLVTLDVLYITSLRNLFCHSCNLQELRITGCDSLVEFQCQNNPLSILEIADLPMIESIICKNGALEEIKIDNCPSLSMIDCRNNILSKLEISGCENLKTIECDENELENLDLTSCISLYSLNCSSNKLVNLNLSHLEELENVECDNNPFEYLDLSYCTKLQNIDFPNSYSICVNLSGCSALTNYIAINRIAHEINLTGCKQLLAAGLIWSRIDSLILEDCTKLGLFISDNSTLRAADFQDCTALNWIQADNLQMETINLRGCTNLETLEINGNQFTQLDLDDCTQLRSLIIYDNLLSELYLSSNLDLQSILAQHNMFRNLPEFLYLPALKVLDVRYNYLTFDDWYNIEELRDYLPRPVFENGLLKEGFAYSPQIEIDPFSENNPGFPVPTPTPPVTEIGDWPTR